MGSGHYPYLVPLATLSFLDAVAAGINVSLERAFSRVLEPDEVVLIERSF